MICMAGSSGLVLVAVRQQGQEAGALDAGRQLALEEGTRAGQAGGRDLAVLGDEVAQRVDILVVDLGDAGDREAAEALATEQQRLGVALRALVLAETAFTTGRGHSELLKSETGYSKRSGLGVEFGDV
eukprot:TRINITY_DN505_c0_g4_i1.p1 TRINITY_DN505_c0_g4~~TRINITY_DN505_c0_g4_i1.p1  ORF type:complete len:128 (+),score=43.19 TRINITY_DN505_c0_g4_i1:146-529(+)